YNGMDRRRTLEIAKAIQSAKGPVYIHCHHGKHRSAGAAGAAAVTLGWLCNTEAEARLKISGTSPDYKGLYRCVAEARPASAGELDFIPDDFPQTATTSGLVNTMVEIEGVFDTLKAVERAGWIAPADQPDLVPLAEAARLADLFRNLRDDENVKSKPAEFSDRLLSASKLTETLEEALGMEKGRPEKLSVIFAPVARTCADCHTKFRD
ncbi:hypothetical protein HYR69_02350, partial [Candidatus Sumerlaeota bacterium]|nr:hypothetical protein [Candidatus Sumerlaeota bacterium]